eukprot:1138726-Pelagomonas_calceolata.AAC.5
MSFSVLFFKRSKACTSKIPEGEEEEEEEEEQEENVQDARKGKGKGCASKTPKDIEQQRTEEKEQVIRKGWETQMREQGQQKVTTAFAALESVASMQQLTRGWLTRAMVDEHGEQA